MSDTKWDTSRQNDGRSDLQRRMEQIQLDRKRPLSSGGPKSNQTADLRRLRTLVDKVVKDFVEADDHLMIQWSGPEQYFISLSHVQVLVLKMAAGNGSMSVHMTSEGMYSQHYQWNFDEPEESIKDALVAGLLEWYKRLF